MNTKVRPDFIDVLGAGQLNGTYAIEDWVKVLDTNPPQGTYTVQAIWGDDRLPIKVGERRLRIGKAVA